MSKGNLNSRAETHRPIQFRAHSFPDLIEELDNAPVSIPEPTPSAKKQLRRQRKSEWLKGRSCAWCGATKNLHTDHIDRSTKEMNPAEVFDLSPKNPRVAAELAKCQILCIRCHGKKTAREIGWVRGAK